MRYDLRNDYNSIYFPYLVLLTIGFVLYTVYKSGTKNTLRDLTLLLWISLGALFKTNLSLSWTSWRFANLKNLDKIIAIFLTCYFIVGYITKKNRYKSISMKFQTYEKFLLLYLVTAIIIYKIHQELGNLYPGREELFMLLYLSALPIFIFFRFTLSKEFIHSFLKLVLFMSVTTSIIGTIQFFYLSPFLRLSNTSPAFGGYFRSSGFFPEPGSHGIFLNMGLFTALFYTKKKWVKHLLVGFFLFNIFLIFSRAIWMGTIASLTLHYLYFYTNIHRKRIIYYAVVILLLILIPFFRNLGKENARASDIAGRVFQDTVSSRFDYYSYALSAIPEKLLIGFGDTYKNDHYFRGMVSVNQKLRWALGFEGGLHNLIIEEAYLRGIICTSFFLLFFIYFFKFLLEESVKRKSFIYLLPLNFCISFFVYEMTVSGFLVSYTGFMTVFMASFAAGIRYKNLDVDNFKFPNPEKMKRLMMTYEIS